MNPSKTPALTVALFGALTVMGIHSRAQTIKPQQKDNAPQKTSHWVVGATYLNNSVYLGRKDSIAVPYFTPSFGYHDKSGFFLTGSFSYLLSAGENRIDVGTIEGGYTYSSDKLNAEFSAAKDFYSDQSYAVTSEILGRLSASVSYDLDVVEPSLDLGAEFSGSTDIGLGLGLAHSFTIVEDRFEVDPAFHINMATQNYYGNYYSKRRYSANRKGGTNNVAANVADASKFQIMDYELEAPFEYNIAKKLKFTFTPTLAIPVNPSTVTVATGTSRGSTRTQTTTESLSTTFYFSLGCSYTF